VSCNCNKTPIIGQNLNIDDKLNHRIDSNIVITVKPMNDDGDPSKIIEINCDSLNQLISEANKKYKITHNIALNLLLDIKEINEIINYDYKDNKTFNQLNIIGFPSETDTRWEIDMGQYQEEIRSKYYSFIKFWVNANTGKIEVLDLNYGVDDPISLDEWLRLKKNSN